MKTEDKTQKVENKMIISFQINGGRLYEGEIYNGEGTPEESTFVLHTKWKLLDEDKHGESK